ncbi:MAG: hhoA 2 [Gemmataceae bacterium]|nr:hhoA 2 [Gemmataceae bacterium]
MSTVVCPSCETRLQVPTLQPGKRVTCPRCKHQFLPADTDDPETTDSRPVPRNRYRPLRRKTPAPLSLDDDQPEQQRRGRGTLIVGLVGALVLVVAAGGGVAWWLVARKANRPPEATAEADRAVPKPADPKPADLKPADPKPADPAPPQARAEDKAPKTLSGEQVNQRLLKSTVFITLTDKGGGGRVTSCGSGFLVHKSRGLVVSNYHVVEESQQVNVYFPAFGPQGDLITDPAHYIKNSVDLLISGKVVGRDPRVDLALVELERVPDEAVGLPLAVKPAVAGSTVYSLGASGVKFPNFSGTLWRLSTGTVRGRYKDSMNYKGGQKVEAMLLETQKPSNPGDSGGPTVNDRGELVAVVAAGDLRADLVEKDIDLSEVKVYLTAFALKNGWAWEDQAGAPVPAAPTSPAEETVPLPALVARTRTGETDARVDAVRRLGLMKGGARAAVPALVDLLDDPDERVRRIAAVAIDQIGPPAKEDLGCVGKALAGAGKFGRLYALGYYSTAEKVSRDQLPALTAALDDRDAEIREAALRAVAFYGPDSKPVVFGRLLIRALDPDPAAASTAARVLAAFAPYEGAERKILVDNLRAPQLSLRCLSVVLLTAPDETTALEWFEPRLADESAEIRAGAVRAVAKWGPGVKKVLPTLIALTRDENVKVRTAAVRAVGEIGGGPGAVAAVARFLDPDTGPALRELAGRVLLGLEMTEPATDGPVLATLLKVDDPAVKAAVLAKLARLGPAAVKDQLPAVAECLKSPNPAVQLHALKAVAAVGPEAAPHAPQVVELMSRAPAAAGAVPGPAPAPGPLSGEQLADRLRKSAAWVIVERFGQQTDSGNATLIDAADRLILTNYHVAAAGDSFTICFPVREGTELKSTPAYYAANLQRLTKAGYATTGRVVAKSPQADLAIIQLDTAPPPGVVALPLARESARPGQSLHTVGAVGVNLARMEGALWRYTQGKVLNIYDHRMNLYGVQPVACRVLETDIPMNPGDSGGAVANDRGELVGVNTAVDPAKRTVSFAIELGVVRGSADSRRGTGRPATGGAVLDAGPMPGATDSTQVQAVSTLGRLGPTTTDALAKALEEKLPRDVRVRICEVLAERGRDVPATAIPYIVLAADRDATLRPAAADALVRIGGDEVVKGLKERTAWSFRNTSGGKEKVAKYPADLQVWATQTLGKLDPKKLSDKERNALRERLEGLGAHHPDDNVRKEADGSLAKLLAAGLRPEKKP